MWRLLLITTGVVFVFGSAVNAQYVVSYQTGSIQTCGPNGCGPSSVMYGTLPSFHYRQYPVQLHQQAYQPYFQQNYQVPVICGPSGCGPAGYYPYSDNRGYQTSVRRFESRMVLRRW